MSGRRFVGVGDAGERVDLEIRHHLEELADRLEAEGLPRAEALREAERRFGDVTHVRSEMERETRQRERRMRVREWFGTMGGDLRHALRGLARSPVFAATVVCTVALGMGATTAVFAVVDALLLRPLPYADVDRLVEVNLQRENGSLPFVMADQLEAWDEAEGPFDAFAFYDLENMLRVGGSGAAMVRVLQVSHDLDDLLGVPLRAGRGFGEEDAVPGVRRVLLSSAYAEQNGGVAAVLGSTIDLEGERHEVIGVVQDGFKFPVSGAGADAWLVVSRDLTAGGRALTRASVVARLSPGVSLDGAQARMDVLADAFQEQAPNDLGWRVRLTALGEWRANPDLKKGSWLLAAGVGLMLLIALVNGINLMLFRTADRGRELAVRLALGGGRVRIVRTLLAEGLVTGLASGIAAVLLAWIGVAGLSRLMPQEYAFSAVYAFRIEQRVLLFTFVAALAVGVVLGLIPAGIALARAAHIDVLKGRGSTRRVSRLNRGLVGTEVALAIVLLAGGSMLARTVLHLTRKDTGFDDRSLVVLSLQLPASRYTAPAQRGQFFQRLEQRLEAKPGVRAVTVSDGIPPHVGFSFDVALQAEGSDPVDTGDDFFFVPGMSAPPDYLEVIGARLVAGRDFTAADIGSGNVIIDEPLARLLWRDDPIGKRFRLDEDAGWLTVTGVVAHMTLLGLDDRIAPYAIVRPRDPATAGAYMSVGIQVAGDTRAILPVIREAVRELDPELPISRLDPVRAALIDSIEKPMFLASVMLAVAATALVLAALGIYGVLSYAVAQRRREMGIRIALGSQPAHVRALVIRDGLAVTLAGTVIGLLAVLGLRRAIASMLVGVPSNDPVTLLGVAVVVLGAAALAAWVPARRATRVDPIQVLRAE